MEKDMLRFMVRLAYTFLWLMCQMTDSQVDAKCLVDRASPTCRHRSITCPACVEVAWLIRPPFSYEVGNATVGILPAVLNLLLNKCCGKTEPKCWEVNHKPPEVDAEQLLVASHDSHVTYPVIVDMQDERSLGDNLISFIPPTSIAFVVRRGKPESYPKKLLMSVFEAWPVLILTILLSILAGFNQWFLDTWFNEEEFPRTFFRGSWEGFWWAFVSMTTVGYGDRAPKSILGRVFAVVWILIGICICSIFTATLTTSLTTISLDTKKSLPGSKVGVLERSIEMALAMQQQADLKLYKTIEEMRTAIDREEVEGVLLDNYQISHFTQTLFPSEDFKTDEIIKQETLSYGAMVNDTNLARCFKEIITKDKYLLYEFTRNELKNTLKGGESEAVRNSQSIFDPTGDLFFPSLYTCIALVVVIFFIGLVAELCYFRPGRCAWKKRGKELKEKIPLSEKQVDFPLDQIEEQMLNEVRALFSKYRNSLEQAKDMKNNGNWHSTV